jgi:hypothetical protein
MTARSAGVKRSPRLAARADKLSSDESIPDLVRDPAYSSAATRPSTTQNVESEPIGALNKLFFLFLSFAAARAKALKAATAERVTQENGCWCWAFST